VTMIDVSTSPEIARRIPIFMPRRDPLSAVISPARFPTVQ
jgi:hypothetical protein